MIHALSHRSRLIAFVAGCAGVTAGVILHVPMYLMGRGNGYRLADMPMDNGMLWGMAFIIGGIVLAGYGLYPRAPHATDRTHRIVVTAPEDAPLGPAHFRLMVVLTVALVIDVMKPASLGFVVPGMTVEYEVSRTFVAWLPFAALCGTVVGSIVWGVLADLYGRRASMLLSAVMFVGTSICGAMPSFWWNVGMCFLMGAAAGGMLPVAYALLAETMPSRHRGWVLVLVGGMGAIGGYLAASGCAAWLEPVFSWRILWFLNLPTGLVLILLGGLIPESPRFLISQGHQREADAILRRFGCVRREEVDAAEETASYALRGEIPHWVWMTIALTVAATSWGLMNFGLLLWMPAILVEKGHAMGSSSQLLATSALLAFPTVFLAAWLYSRWSTKGALMASIFVSLLGLVSLAIPEESGVSAMWSIALLIVGCNGIIAMLLPYAAESYPMRIRGRATGWVAACTKGGGLLAQAMSLFGLVPDLAGIVLLLLAPVLAALFLIGRFCIETRGLDLRRFEMPTGI